MLKIVDLNRISRRIQNTKRKFSVSTKLILIVLNAFIEDNNSRITKT